MRFKLLSLLLLTGLVFASCSTTEEKVDELVAKGGKKYGGEFKFMSSEKINTLYPSETVDLFTMRLISQIYESLLSIDPETGQVTPWVAESFSVSDDAKVYTFKIRKGIKFHKDACFGKKLHELNAEDVKFSLDMACSGLPTNEMAYLLTNRVEGATEFNEKSKNSIPKGGVSGIKVVDDYTVQITLVEPFYGFEKVLTHRNLGITPKEAYDKYGKQIGKHPVGSGPFLLETFSNEKITLKRNPNYWKKDELGNQLPFMAKVEMTYAKDKRSEMLAFRKSEIDMVLELPVDEIEHILGTLEEAKDNVKHKVQSQMSMSMMYIGMANESDEFKDPRVRQAFSLAINRDEIIDIDLEGEGWAANNGFVPSMNDYPSEKVRGRKHDVAKAQNLMKSAGFSNGNNFPTLDFYVNAIEGSSVHRTCDAIAKQLKENLNVNLNIVLCTIPERDAAISNEKAKIWRSGWIADYPDAENFLTMFYSKNIRDNAMMINAFRFNNTSFDSAYEKAIIEPDVEKRKSLLVKCDQIVVNEVPVIPVLTDDHSVMINARVRNFKATAMEDLNLTDVFIKEARK